MFKINDCIKFNRLEQVTWRGIDEVITCKSPGTSMVLVAEKRMN